MQDQTTQNHKNDSQKNDNDDNERNGGLHAYVKYSGLAFQMLAIILISVWGGTKLDKLFLLETPIFTIILSLLGVAAAIFTAVKDFIKK
ncbi:MAG TPA: AtpZ/AtpI family protein [Bacteroidales bacterium]|nr:AtpZ/AtpI family protein [Bacteroidales bacterium]HQJ21575.1 AtpZ/AtpI family protein [Bacteroidales bacterium]